MKENEQIYILILEKTIENKNTELFIKRQADMVLSLFLILLLSPLFLIIALLIKINSQGKVIYNSKRIGKNEKTFYMYKFRTMNVNAELDLHENPKFKKQFYKKFKIAGDQRVTFPGKILRRCGLDELPQLFNILKGEMSFVGPRPILPEELERCKQARLAVMPGLTGYWQIMGKNALDYSDKAKWDEEYVRKWSLMLDLKIFIMTIPAIIKGRGF